MGHTDAAAPADRAVLFDLDGTLLRYAEFGAVVAAPFREVCGRYDVAWGEHNSERFFEHFGALTPDPFRRSFAETCERFGLDADPEALVAARVDAECSLSTVPDAAHETLDVLADAGHPLGVVTNGVGAVQREKLAAHDLLDRFDAVVASYDVGAHKPALAPFEAARDALGAAEFVMVGDSDDDVEGARGVGMGALRVADGSFPTASAVRDAF
ncbi:HAD family hydrolase [Halomarina rubra]|uniref:HAD family hydrolase n=1 Tax=Halomarina rubra TaxID=2071873 RepID=A0ABD6AVU4_9EURY|nr:HAD family hydrolase [Halomarina rubra]